MPFCISASKPQGGFLPTCLLHSHSPHRKRVSFFMPCDTKSLFSSWEVCSSDSSYSVPTHASKCCKHPSLHMIITHTARLKTPPLPPIACLPDNTWNLQICQLHACPSSALHTQLTSSLPFSPRSPSLSHSIRFDTTALAHFPSGKTDPRNSPHNLQAPLLSRPAVCMHHPSKTSVLTDSSPIACYFHALNVLYGTTIFLPQLSIVPSSF